MSSPTETETPAPRDDVGSLPSLRIGVSCYPTYGGSGVVASELALALAEHGHDVHVLSYRRPPRLAEANGTSLRFHEVQVKHYPLFEYPPYSLALATKMVEVARAEQLDVMHVHYAVPNAVSALLAQQILRPQRLPVVTTLHGTDVTLVGRDPSYLETTRWGVEHSDAVTAVSCWLEERTREQLGTTRSIEVVSNFVDSARFRPAVAGAAAAAAAPGDPALDEALPLLLHISNYRRIKRVLDVLRVFVAVQRQHPSRLVLVGDGPERCNAEEFCSEHGLGDAVQFVDEHPRVEELVRQAALFLLTSQQESFGLAALEAMASAVPVLATRVGGLPEVVEHEVTGMLFELGDTEAMARGALALLADPQRRRTMGAAGRRAATERFGRAGIVAQYESVYRRVCLAATAAR